jgi:hypothetical protein
MQLCNIVKSGWELKKCNKQDEINKWQQSYWISFIFLFFLFKYSAVVIAVAVPTALEHKIQRKKKERE